MTTLEREADRMLDEYLDTVEDDSEDLLRYSVRYRRQQYRRAREEYLSDYGEE